MRQDDLFIGGAYIAGRFRADDLQGSIQMTPFRKLVEMSAVLFMLDQLR